MRKSNALLAALSLAGIAVLISLGAWQLKRLEWKQRLISLHEQAAASEPVSLNDIEAGIENGFDVDLLRTTATGYYRHDLERHVYALRKGEIGWKVVTPFVIPGRFIVLVDRGFVPDARKDASRRPESVQVGDLPVELKTKPRGQWPDPIEIAGYVRVRAASPGLFVPDNDPTNNSWYSYDLMAMNRTLPEDLGVLPPDQYASMLAVYLQIEPGGEPGDGDLPIVDPLETSLPNSHLQYAITWFALAVVLAVMSVVFIRTRRKRSDR